MNIKHNEEKIATLAERWTVIIFVLVFLLFIAAEIMMNYEPRKLAAVFFLLWWMPLVFIHEFGHALAARWFGWPIERTVIGFGSILYRGRLFKAPMEFRLVPIEGFVQFKPPVQTEQSRGKLALLYFAGPGIELLVFGIILWLMGVDNFFTIEDNYSKLALQALAFAALAGAIINLIPMGVSTKDGVAPNDGLGILLSLFGKKSPHTD